MLFLFLTSCAYYDGNLTSPQLILGFETPKPDITKPSDWGLAEKRY